MTAEERLEKWRAMVARGEMSSWKLKYLQSLQRRVAEGNLTPADVKFTEKYLRLATEGKKPANQVNLTIKPCETAQPTLTDLLRALELHRLLFLCFCEAKRINVHGNLETLSGSEGTVRLSLWWDEVEPERDGTWPGGILFKYQGGIEFTVDTCALDIFRTQRGKPVQVDGKSRCSR